MQNECSVKIYMVQFERRTALTLHFVTVNSGAVNSVAAIF